MATKVVSCNSLPWQAPALQLPKAQGRQLSGGSVHVEGILNSLVGKLKLENQFPATRTGRTAGYSPKIWELNKLHNRFRTAIQAASDAGVEGGDLNFKGNSSKQPDFNFLQRRELLWGTTGTLSYLSTVGRGQSDPLPPSDLLDCAIVNLQTPGETENCCPVGAPTLEAVPFEFEVDLPIRTRRAAHILSKDLDYVAKYNEAYKRMNALPDSDPRSLKAQWHLHCSLCEDSYLEPGNVNKLPLQYHFSWVFLPWHRMYLYFHERILGDLIGDPTFALPFWNWDNQRSADGGNQMPRMVYDDLGDVNDQLHDPNRDPAHYPPTLVDLAFLGTGVEEDIVKANLSLINLAIVSTTATDLFMGGPYVAGQAEGTNLPGSLEFYLHNPVHGWTGDPNLPDSRDMGGFVFAARDPLFFQHHANVDRLWAVWKSLPMDEATESGTRCRMESADPDFLDAKFAFHDHNQQLVHVSIRDTMDTTKLRYHYETMPSDEDWIYFETASGSTAELSQADIEQFSATDNELSKDVPTTFLLRRRVPTAAEIAAHADEGLVAEDLEESLVVKGVMAPMSKYMIYRVFINLATADDKTPLDIHEFVGIITHVPHVPRVGAAPERGIDFRLSIGAAVKKLGIPRGQSISVTFVPHGQDEGVSFDGLDTEWR